MSQRLFYDATEVSDMLGISKSSAYSIIKRLNSELEKKGYLVLKGKISKVYFSEKWYGGDNENMIGEKIESVI